MRSNKFAAVCASLTLVILGCSQTATPSESAATSESPLTLQDVASVLRGKRLFEHETFGGNGRVCSTCHEGDTLDLQPTNVQALYAINPNAPLFRPIDSDDGTGLDYSLLLRDATVRSCFDLPANIRVLETTSPNVTPLPDGRQRLCVRRAPPSVNNSSLEALLMWDGRNANSLTAQALGAVNAHYQPVRQPSTQQLEDIARFERTQFSNLRTRVFAAGGPAPTLPEVPPGSHFDNLRRGREFFVDQPVNAIGAGPRGGICATCHSGPMLDATNEFNPFVQAGFSMPGERFNTNGSSEFNIKDERFTFVIQEPPGTPFAGQTLVTNVPDLGRAMVTGSFCRDFIGGCFSRPGSGAAAFRTPTLWGSADTAPYFHDHSQPDLEGVLNHYQQFFVVTTQTTGDSRFEMTVQERADIVAYMRYAFRTLKL